MRQKLLELLGIKEAMDNLAAIASINMESPPPIGVLGETRIITNPEEASSDIRWLSGEGADVLLQVLDLTYRTIYQHLQNLDESGNWESPKSREGLAAMMALVGESAPKMNAYLAFRLDHPLKEKVEQRASYRALQRFYSEKFAGKGEQGGVDSLLEAKGTERKDFEALLRDKEYELFYITNEEGEPYLSEHLLRNLKLTADFDVETGSFEEDPFLKVKAILDRDIKACAAWILQECHAEIETFYKGAKKTFHHAFAKSLSKAIMALFLAANPRHLVQRTERKNCGRYFHDFHLFLREAMRSFEYQKWISYPPPSSDKEAHLLLDLTHKLCFSLLHRRTGVRQEAIGLIHRTMRRGEEVQPKQQRQKAEGVWEEMLLDDEKLRTWLRKFPSGPLLKILDTVRHDQDEGIWTPFDPWIQDNLPTHLYTLKSGKKEVEVLSFAAPMRQGRINQVELIDEFRGYLRYLKATGKKHLLINLQDRFSWKETARSTAMEELQKNPSFSESLIVITLPKDSDFYHQKNAYANLEDAKDFLGAFKQQIDQAEQSGFYFPSQWKKKDVLRLADSLLTLIHKQAFDNQKKLTRRMREDFIEIFYQLFVKEALSFFKADLLSFTCKDGIDAGAYASGCFYGFAKALDTKEDLDCLRFLFYWRALSIRERAADPEQFLRTLSALETWSRRK